MPQVLELSPAGGIKKESFKRNINNLPKPGHVRIKGDKKRKKKKETEGILPPKCKSMDLIIFVWVCV